MALEIIIIVASVGIFVILARKIPAVISNRKTMANEQIKIRKSLLAEKSFLDQAESNFKKGDLGQAEKFYLRAAAEDPKNPKIYNRLGAIYMENKNFKDASDAFREAIKYDDKLPSRHFNYALACLELKDHKSAKESLEKALQLDSNNTKYQSMLEKISKKH